MEDMWKNIDEENPERFGNIVGVTSVGSMKGFYLKDDIMQTKNGMFNFTKWKKEE